MPAFVWKGKTRDGKVVSGERVADNKESVMAILRRDQILVSSVKEKGREIALPKFGGGVPAKDLAIFTRQFSVMIDAGLPLVQCLEILGSQQENKTFAKVLQQTRMDVEGGASLADAMRKHPKAFDDLFTNMIAAGEAGGILDTILKRLAVYIEKAVKLKGQVQSAMIYPIAVIVIAGAVVGVILWKVIPTFASLFAGLGAELGAHLDLRADVGDLQTQDDAGGVAMRLDLGQLVGVVEGQGYRSHAQPGTQGAAGKNHVFGGLALKLGFLL